MIFLKIFLAWKLEGVEIKKLSEKMNFREFLWCHQESNRGHTDFQSVALPTELWHPRKCGAKIKVFSSVQTVLAKKRLFF